MVSLFLLDDRYFFFQLYVRINGMTPRKLLKFISVRWLSLYNCVDIILKQWDELVAFFDSERENGDWENRSSARRLYEMLTSPSNKVILLLLVHTSFLM